MNRYQKALNAKAEKAVAYKEQTFQISPEWSIIRADALSWEIQHNGKFQGSYGRLLDAFRALPHKMLHQDVKNSLAEVERRLLAIHVMIERALK